MLEPPHASFVPVMKINENSGLNLLLQAGASPGDDAFQA
jgi:hypothetical protein